MEQQNSIGADVNEDPVDENEDRKNVQLLGEIVDAALDTEDVTAVINLLLLERPSATDISSTENDDEVVNVVEVVVAAGEENNGGAFPEDHHRQIKEYTRAL